jgi:hypothetical protein
MIPQPAKNGVIADKQVNAVREVAANMGGSLGSNINISTNAGAQFASDLGKGLIQGTSQYIAKKMRAR